jgi:MtN3 and saliva related transmembrane protein
MAMVVTMTLGIVLWIFYGFLRHELAIITANLVALVIAVSILMLKLRHG